VTLYFGYKGAMTCTVKARMSDESAALNDLTLTSTTIENKQHKIVYRCKGAQSDARLILDVIKNGTSGQLFITGVTVSNA
jgi:hypothetical protein